MNFSKDEILFDTTLPTNSKEFQFSNFNNIRFSKWVFENLIT
jgi:hypothetical protein